MPVLLSFWEVDFARRNGRPRLRALDGRHLLEKVDENFSQKSFLEG